MRLCPTRMRGTSPGNSIVKTRRSCRKMRPSVAASGKEPRPVKVLLCYRAWRSVAGAAGGCRCSIMSGHLYPDYICGARASRYGQKQCQRISGQSLARALGELLLATVSPLNLEVAISIQRELETRLEEVDRLRRQVVQRAQQEVDLKVIVSASWHAMW